MLSDDGIRELILAIFREAAEEYITLIRREKQIAQRKEEVESFFSSQWAEWLADSIDLNITRLVKGILEHEQ